jgi:hypothetical protein
VSYPEFLHEILYEAAKTYLATRQRVFRVMPVGAIGSAARVQQDAEIAAEDKLLAAIKNYEAALPGQSGEGRL